MVMVMMVVGGGSVSLEIEMEAISYSSNQSAEDGHSLVTGQQRIYDPHVARTVRVSGQRMRRRSQFTEHSRI